jgi:hypothetical protein
MWNDLTFQGQIRTVHLPHTIKGAFPTISEPQFMFGHWETEALPLHNKATIGHVPNFAQDAVRQHMSGDHLQLRSAPDLNGVGTTARGLTFIAEDNLVRGEEGRLETTLRLHFMFFIWVPRSN